MNFKISPEFTRRNKLDIDDIYELCETLKQIDLLGLSRYVKESDVELMISGEIGMDDIEELGKKIEEKGELSDSFSNETLGSLIKMLNGEYESTSENASITDKPEPAKCLKEVDEPNYSGQAAQSKNSSSSADSAEAGIDRIKAMATPQLLREYGLTMYDLRELYSNLEKIESLGLEKYVTKEDVKLMLLGKINMDRVEELGRHIGEIGVLPHSFRGESLEGLLGFLVSYSKYSMEDSQFDKLLKWGRENIVAILFGAAIFYTLIDSCISKSDGNSSADSKILIQEHYLKKAPMSLEKYTIPDP